MKFFFNLIIVFCLTVAVSHAQSFMNITADPADSFNAVLVEKSGKWLHVLKVDGNSVETIDSFQVLTGGVDGDKVVQGDEKTPEGLYFVTGFLSPEKLRSMYPENIARQYGTGAYPLSYPNLKDRLDGKTGGGIWLHGVDPEREETATKGCVAFENEKLTKLADYIGVGTPVIITDEGMQGAADQLREHFAKMKKIVEDYVEAWSSNDIEKFGSFYHSEFKSTTGQKLAGYLKYKKTLMDYYPYRRVDISNFRIFSQSADEAVAEFDQAYCAPNVYSYGRKRFYLENENGMKIAVEEFRQMDGTHFVRSRVNEFLINWKNSWESLDTEKYMANYSESFRTRGMDKQGWKDDKAGKFAELKNVKVVIDSISYTAHSPVSYSIEFRQVYQGDSYTDTGIKTLKVEGCPGDFKIVSEYWRAM